MSDVGEQLANAEAALAAKTAELEKCRLSMYKVKNENVDLRRETERLKNKLAETEWSIETTQTSIQVSCTEVQLLSRLE